MANAKATILVVDDDVEIVAMVQTRLEKKYRVVTAIDGKSALEVASRERPALMLLDVMMPGKSGWEVAKAIRQDPALKGTKIVIVSAIGPAVTDATSSLYGADAHIDKPFEFAKLEEIIARLI